VAALVSLLPVLAGFSGRRIFYVRDLSSFFWERHLWIRREWLSGHVPLWDPHVGAGQAAYVDALHQMFLLPAVLVRLIGNDAFGFNLWVMTPLPLAAVGTWLFFARRMSHRAAAFGAVVFAASGPVLSTTDFPNLSWSVAMLPWVLWATDRLVVTPRPRAVGILALTVAGQCLAGEPVTQFMTLGMSLCWAAVMAADTFDVRASARSVLLTAAGLSFGLALAAIQLVPMTLASALAQRGDTIIPDTWSLRPTALPELVWLHLFGNYFDTQSLTDVPWMPLLFTGREPLLFSLYFGTPALSLAICGLAGVAPRRERLFWVVIGLMSLVGAFGSYTPIYPLLRDHVPPFGTFRFPIKYIFVAVLAVAAGAAYGLEQLLAPRADAPDEASRRRWTRSRALSVGFAAWIALSVGAFGAACLWAPDRVRGPLQGFAVLLGDESGTAADWMIRAAPHGAVSVVILAAIAAVLLLRAASGRTPHVLRWSVGLLALVAVCDLVVHGWGVNPVMDASRLSEPAWLAQTRADPNSRFYVGGKFEGTLDSMDFDSSRGFEDAPGLHGSASRAALSVQAAFYPSAWGGRELLSYDLPVLWPRLFNQMTKQFIQATREERERFLDRTAVRYRVLPQRRAGRRTPLMAIPQFFESFLFDFGDVAGARASVVPEARVLPDPQAQLKALFAPGWESRHTVLLEHDAAAEGTASAPVAPSASVVVDEGNRTVVDAGVGPGGGYLVLLDSFDPDWRVRVDGQPASVVRANGLFRAVRLTEGRHRVRFDYRPRALLWGAAMSLAGAFGVGLLLFERQRHLQALWALLPLSSSAPADTVALSELA
jgi:hypothetical protein